MNGVLTWLGGTAAPLRSAPYVPRSLYSLSILATIEVTCAQVAPCYEWMLRPLPFLIASRPGIKARGVPGLALA